MKPDPEIKAWERRYHFAAAAGLYEKAIHPRIMLGPDDVQTLRKMVRSGPGKKIMNALRKKVHRLASVPNSLAVKVTWPEVEDTLIFAYEHHLLEAGDIRGRGQWCAVRKSRQSGRVLDAQLGHGTNLEVRGRPV